MIGAVYKGRQKSLDRMVAVKIIPPGQEDNAARFVERFKNEARTMARLNHPGIVTVHEFGETAQGQLFFIMEYVDGTDVAKMIQSGGKLPQDRALEIITHVCDALAYAHGNGVVHRDIKPANILINRQGQIKVADFGLAKLDDPAQSSGLTQTGCVVGTPDYVSPEALIMGADIDARADLYAVGVMLYQMLAGEIPRGLFQMPSVRSKGETDLRFDSIISKAMQTDREARYQSALDLRRDLDAIRSTPPIKPEVASLKSKSPNSKPKAGLYLGMAAAIVVMGAAALMFSGGSPTTRNTTAAIESGKWIDGLTEWWAKPESQRLGRIAREAGGWRVLKRGSIIVGSAEFKDVALRATVRGRGTTAWECQLRGSSTGDSYLARMEATEFVMKRIAASQPVAVLQQVALPVGFSLDAGATMEFRAQGDVLTFFLNGRQLAQAKDSTLTTGVASFYGAEGALIEKLEYQNLSVPPSDRSGGDRWTDGLTEWWKQPQKGDTVGLLTQEAGGSRVTSTTRKGVFFADGAKLKDLAVRVTVRGISEYCALYFRHEASENYQAVLVRDGACKIVLTKIGGGELVRSSPIPGFDAARTHVFEFTALGDRLTVKVDGVETCTVENQTLQAAGMFYFTGDTGTLIEKLEYRALKP